LAVGKTLPQAEAGSRRRVPAWLVQAGGALASIFLPAGCRLCEQLLARASRLPICEDCLESFSRIEGSICDPCGLPLAPISGKQSDEELRLL
jgi:hypothetical protein